MKKPTPMYKEITKANGKLPEIAGKVRAYDEALADSILAIWARIGVSLSVIERRYKAAAKKSSGPRVTTEKKARASRENLRKAALALTPEQRSERARKAICARWAKAKKKS